MDFSISPMPRTTTYGITSLFVAAEAGGLFLFRNQREAVYNFMPFQGIFISDLRSASSAFWGVIIFAVEYAKIAFIDHFLIPFYINRPSCAHYFFGKVGFFITPKQIVSVTVVYEREFPAHKNSFNVRISLLYFGYYRVA